MKITLEIEPLPQPRPRFSRGRCYEPSRISRYKEQVRAAAVELMAGAAPTESPLAVFLTFVRKFKPSSRRFGDADNLAKAVLDACTGVIWKDDAQIVRAVLTKQQAAAARLELEVTECIPK